MKRVRQAQEKKSSQEFTVSFDKKAYISLPFPWVPVPGCDCKDCKGANGGEIVPAKKAKGKLAKTQGPLKTGAMGFDLTTPPKPELTEYEKEKVKISHFYKMMDDAYTLVKKYEKLLKKIEDEKQAKANPPPKGVTFTL